MKAMVLKVPHVHGNLSDSMAELMDANSMWGVWGAEKLCTARNLPVFPGFAMMESGDVWKGPMSVSVSR
jgi:hypothetical protein